MLVGILVHSAAKGHEQDKIQKKGLVLDKAPPTCKTLLSGSLKSREACLG